MLLLTIALQILTLIEYVSRKELAKTNDYIAGLVPGNPKMKTKQPTAERLLSAFENINLLIKENRKTVKGVVVESLSTLQKKILSILKLSENIFNLSFNEKINSAWKNKRKVSEQTVVGYCTWFLPSTNGTGLNYTAHTTTEGLGEKESNKWIKSYQTVEQIQKACPNTTLISVADRESDIYELFVEAAKNPNSPKLLILALHEIFKKALRQCTVLKICIWTPTRARTDLRRTVFFQVMNKAIW